MINCKPFGALEDKTQTTLYSIENGKYRVDITDFGATLVSFFTPDCDGNIVDVLLGYDDVQGYVKNSGYVGAVIGRFANRIENGKLILNGKEYDLYINNGPNHLHGGKVGFSHRVFDTEIIDDNTIKFSLLSPDGEENYPGNLELSVVYSLSVDGELSLDYTATTDADTVINITNHAYFNLNGTHEQNTIHNHTLQVNASAFCESDKNCLANGNILAVRNTPFDFRAPKRLDDIFNNTEFSPIVAVGGGIDNNFCLTDGYKKCAEVYSDKTGITLECFTNQPAVQVYTSNSMTERVGKLGVKYAKYSAICLETQTYPNAPAFAHFPSAVLKKGEVYKHKTVYKFSAK